MPAESLYLDHAATTPLRPEVADAMDRAQAEAFANPSSQHAAGRRAKKILEDARDRILSAIGGRMSATARDRVVFTSGASEANRLAILGRFGVVPGAVATSARDHASLRLAAAGAGERGWKVAHLALDHEGRLDPSALASWLAASASAAECLLATTLVCGQSGSVERIAAIITECGSRARVHTDATQAIGTEDVSFANLQVATLTLAPHKFGGPRGIGGLVVRHDHPLAPLLPGTQETGLRGGTEPVALAAGFATALDLAVAERAATRRRLAALRDDLETGMLRAARACGLSALVVGSEAARAAHLATIAFPGCDRQALVMAADLAGLCCSTGSACSSGSSEPAPALVAMGLPLDVVAGAVRFSVGRETTADDVDRAVELFRNVLAAATSTGRSSS